MWSRIHRSRCDLSKKFHGSKALSTYRMQRTAFQATAEPEPLAFYP